MKNPMFRYLPHTADAKFEAKGETLEEAFASSGKALTGLITNVTKVKPAQAKKIVLRSKSLEDLLVDFLTELLFQLETNGFLFCETESLSIEKKADEYFLEGKILGDHVKRYQTHGQVKAITHHELKIERKGSRYIIQVVVDV